MRWVIFLVCVVLCSGSAFALDELQDTHVFSGNSVAASGKNLVFTLSQGSTRLTVDGKTDFLLNHKACGIDSQNDVITCGGECKTFSDLKVCVEKYVADSCAWSDPLVPCVRVDGQINGQPFAYIKVYDAMPDIQITRTTSAREPVLGKEFTVTTTILNKDETTINDAVYIDEFPNSFTIKSVSSGSISGSTVSHTINELKEGESKTIKYVLVPKEVVDVNLIGSLEVEFDSRIITFESSKTNIRPQYPVQISVDTNVTTPRADQKFDIQMELENVYGEDVDVTSAMIVLPGSLELYDHDFVSRDANKFVWSGEIKKDAKLVFNVTVKPTRKETLDVEMQVTVDAVNAQVSSTPLTDVVQIKLKERIDPKLPNVNLFLYVHFLFTSLIHLFYLLRLTS